MKVAKVSEATGRALRPAGGSLRQALAFVLLLGVVSLFADMTCEGARSITGPFLASLGARAGVVGLVAGAGELIGYGLRIFSGFASDRTGKYWTITLWGYAVNLVAVPLPALAGNWEIAALLIVMERVGKGIRTPARDAMLSHATAETGRGWGFGLHEALDQTGAVLGPLMVAAVLVLNGGYRGGFALLLAPALLALTTLLTARALYPHPRDMERSAPASPRVVDGFPQTFWLYLAFVGVSVAGFAHFQLISYHFTVEAIASEAQTPLLFAVAMGVDALVALAAGRSFDRFGLPTLLAIPFMALRSAPLGFSSGIARVVGGVVLWGAVMGTQETIMRAAVSDMISPARRGAAYGIFNAAYGLSWFLGSATMGALYGAGIGYLIAFSVVLQMASVPFLALVWAHTRNSSARV